MAKQFPWKRFWRRHNASYTLATDGFLFDPDSQYGAVTNPNLTTLDQLQDVPCLALLGEPGIGKSCSLDADVTAFLEKTPGLETVRLNLRGFGSEDRLHRDLFESPVFLRWVAGQHDLHVYLDSFDECLLRIDNVAALLADELPKYPLERLKLRIACRTAVWPPLLENALIAGYGQDKYAAVELVALRRIDVMNAASLTGIADPEGFLNRVDQLQIAGFASKPITLNMLLDTFTRDGDIPTNLFDLYQKGCLILCEEQNPARRIAGRTGTLSSRARLAVAGRLAAVTQFCNRFSVWKGTEGEGVPREDVPIFELVGGTEKAEHVIDVTANAVLETIDTGLFSSRGSQRLGWSHQTFAEFLAARYCLVHDVTIEQLRSIVFHPRRARVIPQIRETASWLALQNQELFKEIAEHDPEVLLGTAAPSMSMEQRRVLTDALLRSSEREDFVHFNHGLPLRYLTHSGLAAQLEPFFCDRTQSESTRYFAMKIARACQVKDLGQALLGVALSDDDSHDLRSIAASAVAEVGSEAEREQMRPLLLLKRADDPDDQLRGAALGGIYPNANYDDSMWDYLEHPQKSSFLGAYQMFLYYAVTPKLNTQNLPVALRWCTKQTVEDFGPIPDLEASIFMLAVEHIEVVGVAEELAAAIYKRCKSHRGFPGRKDEKKKGAADLLAKDDERRRLFLTAFLPLLDKQNESFLLYPLSLLNLRDVDWYIERIVTGVSPEPAIEARLICRLASSWEPETLTTVWTACQSDQVLAEACKELFWTCPLDSELAKLERQSRQDLVKEKGTDAAPAMAPRIEVALTKAESGSVDEWISVLFEMSIEEGEIYGPDLRGMQIPGLMGWLDASPKTKERIVQAAKRYVSETTFPESGPAELRKVRRGASAGVNAMWLLQLNDPAFLQAQSPEFWARWIPSFVEDSRAGNDNLPEVETVFRLAASAAPEVVNVELLTQVERENEGEQRYLFCSGMIDRAWSDSLGQVLLAKLQQNDLASAIQGSLLAMLLEHETVGSREWAEDVVRNDHASQRGKTIASSLLHAGERRAWSVIWPVIQEDTQFGRNLLEGTFILRSDRHSFGAGLSETELESLYIWLAEQYPPKEDRLLSGLVQPVDNMRFLRDGTMEVLKSRGTFASCEAIARIETRLPERNWLRYHFKEAETLACALTWVPPSPHVILAMAQDHNKRFVESSEQLLRLVLESMGRLQAELHGELASVGDLWNNYQNEWLPKQEEDVSDYIARFLRTDLEKRGVVINREVQIRRRRAGEMTGQNTDIHVDAQGPPGSPYGIISLVLEVKGSWNDGLMTDMEGQLRDRYLRNSGCRTGLYVAAHFRAESWLAKDNRRARSLRWNIDDLRERLAEQATSLSTNVTIRSFVLDACLNSMETTGV